VSQTQTTVTRDLLFRPSVQKSGSDLLFWFRCLVQTPGSGSEVWFRPLVKHGHNGLGNFIGGFSVVDSVKSLAMEMVIDPIMKLDLPAVNVKVPSVTIHVQVHLCQFGPWVCVRSHLGAPAYLYFPFV
jgi:hypothetical protein